MSAHAPTRHSDRRPCFEIIVRSGAIKKNPTNYWPKCTTSATPPTSKLAEYWPDCGQQWPDCGQHWPTVATACQRWPTLATLHEETVSIPVKQMKPISLRDETSETYFTKNTPNETYFTSFRITLRICVDFQPLAKTPVKRFTKKGRGGGGRLLQQKKWRRERDSNPR
jgi:hypothetical protein